MKKFMRNNRSFLISLFLLFVVRGSFADQNYVPSGSMEPTIHVGDHILVNKTAYDLKLPFTNFILKALHQPQRGEIIVFFHPVTDLRLVKRLVGLPGDRIRIENGFVYVNGQPFHQPGDPDNFAASTSDEIYYTEFVGSRRTTVKRTHSLYRPDMLEVEVPQGMFFAMGDNRDNSSDSRSWGFVPRAKIQGQALAVIYNLAWTPLPQIEWDRTATRLN